MPTPADNRAAREWCARKSHARIGAPSAPIPYRQRAMPCVRRNTHGGCLLHRSCWQHPPRELMLLPFQRRLDLAAPAAIKKRKCYGTFGLPTLLHNHVQLLSQRCRGTRFPKEIESGKKSGKSIVWQDVQRHLIEMSGFAVAAHA